MFFQISNAQNITDYHTHLQDSPLIKYLNQLDNTSPDDTSIKDSLLFNADSLINERNIAHVDKSIILSCTYMFESAIMNVKNEYEKVRNENDYIAQQTALYLKSTLGERIMQNMLKNICLLF